MIPHVPPNTFIANYMEYMQDQETPAVYDFACAAWVLSNALGRGVTVARPRAPVHLNMYLILVSESGIMRKSTSIRHATSLLRQFYDDTANKTMLVESRTTTGAVLHELSHSTRKNGFAHMVLVASELAASFGRNAGIGNLTALLTDLYDCPDVRTGGGATSRGEVDYLNLRNVYMGLIAGTTPVWLAHAVTPTIIEGGFTSRCYFVVGRQRKRSIAWPVERDTSEQRAKLITQLKEIKHDAETYPRIGISDSGLEAFRHWYENRSLHRDTYRESFESREDGHVLRFAALFSANERCWHINHDHVARAIRFVGDVKSAGTELFTGANVREADLKWINRLRDILLKAGPVGISRMDLTQYMKGRGLRGQELRSTLHVMHELDLIHVREITRANGVGRPKTMYYPTEYLKNEAFLRDVTRKLGLEQ